MHAETTLINADQGQTISVNLRAHVQKMCVRIISVAVILSDSEESLKRHFKCHAVLGTNMLQICDAFVT